MVRPQDGWDPWVNKSRVTTPVDAIAICAPTSRLPTASVPAFGARMALTPIRPQSGRWHAVSVERSVDQQRELPAHMTALAHPMRLGDLSERKGLRDRKREALGLVARLELVEELLQRMGHPSTTVRLLARVDRPRLISRRVVERRIEDPQGESRC
jgi:hypothetical protein